MSSSSAPSSSTSSTKRKYQSQHEPQHRLRYDGDRRNSDELTKLVIPWAAMVIVSIVATVVFAYQNQIHEIVTGTTVISSTTTTSQKESIDTLFSYHGNNGSTADNNGGWDELTDPYYPPTFENESANDVHQFNILQRWLQTTTTTTTTSAEHVHVHKPVYEENHASLFPLSNSDRLGFFLAIIGLMIAAGGGIGGGGLLVPIYILVMGFSPKHAIPLSNITVFGGACANMVLNSRKRHPLADRPLIDWDLILVMEPLTIAGALIGAFLNKVLPELFLTIMLVILLTFTAYNTLKKAFKMYKAESRRLREQGLKLDGTKESELTQIAQSEDSEEQNHAGDELLDDMDLQDGENPGTGDDMDSRAEQIRKLETILEEERTVPMFNVNILFGLFIVVLAINLLKGGGAFPSPIGIKCGSSSFWIANGIMLGWIIMISVYVRSYLVKRFNDKESCGYKYQEGDIKWDGRATLIYPIICAAAGFFAGMFGVGGGIVKGPLMLAMGVHPAVASASSACMILFTSFTATTSFYVFGLLDPQYAPVCFTIGFIATYFGQIGLSILMKRAQRNSYIAFSIGGVVLLSSILMTIQSLLSMAEGEHHASGGICGKDS